MPGRALRGAAGALLLLHAACQPASVRGLPRLTCEGGIEGVLPEAFFETFEVFQSRYKRDSLERSREFLYTIYLPKLSGRVDEWLERCPAPALELMLNSLLAIEHDYGLAEAQELFAETMRIAHASGSDPLIQELLQSWQRDTAHTYPFLLGMQPRSCYGTSLKIYVYDVPANLTQPSLHCAGGQWGTEVLFHRFLLSADCRTADPEAADFFYVPVYGTCLSVSADVRNDTDAAALIWDPLVRYLDAEPWLRRRGMRDHVFLFADGQSARIWDSYDLVRGEAILMMVESKCPTWDEPMRRYVDVKACSSAWKDIIISGHTDHARAQQMLLHNRPTEERDILMTFHGRHPGSHEVYKECRVRQDVMDLADFEGVDVGGFVDDYLERKGRSHFCLIPGGTSPWTNHLYESFFCGCIPVILSDEYEVAFQHLLDWPRFSIKWPEAAVGEQLYSFLRAFSEPELRAMKAEVDRHACWFDYWSEDPNCSPYLAVIRGLEERKRGFPRHPGRFWNAGPAIADSGVRGPRRTTRFHTFGEEHFTLP